jgi:hypothetical protein
MAANLTTTWSREDDYVLKTLAREGRHVGQIAEAMGMTASSIRGRAKRLGLHLAPMPRAPNQRPGRTDGHRAADERSAEILRAAGCKI